MHLDCDILFALLGDVRRNSRALRQLRALTTAGYSVHALSLGPDRDLGDVIPNLTLQVLPTPRPRGPRFFVEAHRLVRRAASAIRARVYHASDLYVLPALTQEAQRADAALVYDARELYSGLGSTYRRPWASAFWYAAERRFIGNADLVLTVNASIAERLAQRYRIRQPLVLPNVPEARTVPRSHRLREKAGVGPDVPVLLYQGFLKPGRGCEALLEAIRRVPDCTLVYLGDGALRDVLAERATDDAVRDRVRFVDMVPPDELLELTADADIGACLIEPKTESLRLSLPNKLFEYIAAGVPVLASPVPEIERVVRTYDVGRTVDPANQDRLAATIREMLVDEAGRRRWSANCLRVLEAYDPERITADFVRAYGDLLRAGRTARRQVR